MHPPYSWVSLAQDPGGRGVAHVPALVHVTAVEVRRRAAADEQAVGPGEPREDDDVAGLDEALPVRPVHARELVVGEGFGHHRVAPERFDLVPEPPELMLVRVGAQYQFRRGHPAMRSRDHIAGAGALNRQCSGLFVHGHTLFTDHPEDAADQPARIDQCTGDLDGPVDRRRVDPVPGLRPVHQLDRAARTELVGQLDVTLQPTDLLGGGRHLQIASRIQLRVHPVLPAEPVDLQD